MEGKNAKHKQMNFFQRISAIISRYYSMTDSKSRPGYFVCSGPDLFKIVSDIMEKKAIPCIILLSVLISGPAFSQREEGKTRVHLAPLNFFDPWTGVLQLGAQQKINQRWSVLVDHGFKMQTFRKIMFEEARTKKNQTYSKTKAELKYFLNLKNAEYAHGVFPYLAVEGMCFPQRYAKEKDWIHREDGAYYYESSSVKRVAWVASLKFGKETRFSRIVMDKYIGIGIRRLSIGHRTVGEAREPYFEDNWSFSDANDTYEGTFYKPHLSLGIKIGYIVR